MSDSKNNQKPTQIDALKMFELSAQHLRQLIEFYRTASDKRLTMAVERAIQAHIEATKALMKVDNGVSLKTTRADSAPMEKNAPSPTTDAWMSAPWEYLKIPSQGKSRLGPMPRFIPLPNEDSTKKPQE